MNELIEKFGRLSQVQRIGVGVLLYLLIGLGIYFMLVQPTRDNIAASEARNRTLTETVEEKRDIANNRDEYEKKVEERNEALARAQKELPTEAEIPELLRRVSTIGKKIGLEFLLFQPVDEIKQDFYAEVPVKLRIEGSYHEVATFFDRVGKLNRIVNIRDIQMSNPVERAGRMVMVIEGTAVTYRFLSDSEQKK